MRGATLLLVVLAACSDLRDFEGTWRGTLGGTSPAVRVGVGDGATAELVLDDVDSHGLHGHLRVDTLIDADLIPIEGAEADVLSTLTFSGSPLRVYLAFVPIGDGLGDATAFVSLYDGERVEVRLVRSATPIYAIFALFPQGART